MDPASTITPSSATTSRAEEAVRNIRGFEIDREFLPQSALDVRKRSRVSALPWRGQFTPDLPRTLLRAYTRAGWQILDPFAGSGTTLSEAIRLGLPCIGCEINPAAFELSRIFESARLPADLRREKMQAAATLVNRLTLQDADSQPSLFSLFGQGSREGSLLENLIALRRDTSDSWLANALALSLMIAMGNGSNVDAAKLIRGFNQVVNLVSSLPQDPIPCHVYPADARRLPLVNDSIDFVLTSPPYINVFNYHQNYRPAVELLGYDVLLAARREIGSNRKFRQNRFMTAVQYCLDMMLSLLEMVRVTKARGKLVIIVGRESKIRGVSLENGIIVGSLAELSGGLRLARWQERSFMTRFGERIFEEILTFDVLDTVPLGRDIHLELGRATGCLLLEEAARKASGSDVRSEINAALETAASIEASPFQD